MTTKEKNVLFECVKFAESKLEHTAGKMCTPEQKRAWYAYYALCDVLTKLGIKKEYDEVMK